MIWGAGPAPGPHPLLAGGLDRASMAPRPWPWSTVASIPAASAPWSPPSPRSASPPGAWAHVRLSIPSPACRQNPRARLW